MLPSPHPHTRSRASRFPARRIARPGRRYKHVRSRLVLCAAERKVLLAATSPASKRVDEQGVDAARDVELVAVGGAAVVRALHAHVPAGGAEVLLVERQLVRATADLDPNGNLAWA